MATSAIYLHGFASSPQSAKARYFADRLRRRGLAVTIPDLNYPSFSAMTVSAQVELVTSILDESQEKKLLFGSSMGGLVAALASKRSEQALAMVLLAPGFGIEQRWSDVTGAERMRLWRQQGELPFFHYGAEREEMLSWSFIADLERWRTTDLELTVPTLILHGKNDEIVPVKYSIEIREYNPDTVELQVLEDGHDLHASLETMWQLTEQFLDDSVFRNVD